VQPHQVPTPVENMITQETIKSESQLFTCYLGGWKDANDPDQGKSFYTFGFIDQVRRRIIITSSRKRHTDLLQDVVKGTGQEIHYTAIDNSKGF